jgi:replicative DNA helicase
MTAHTRDFMDRITEDDAFFAAQEFFACVFNDADVLDDCGLQEDDFTSEIHRAVFKHAIDYRLRGQAIAPISLKPHLPKSFRIKGDDDRRKEVESTPAQYLSNLMVRGVDPALRQRLDSNILIIKSMALARSLEREMAVGLEIAREGHTLLTLGDEIEQLESRLKELKDRFSETTAVSSPGSSYLAMFQASARRDGVMGVPIALPEIASVLSEPVFEAGNLYGLLSSSGEGKSSLTMQLICHAVREGHPVLFLSYDQSAAQCVRQMIAQVYGIDVKQQREPMRLMTSKQQDDCVKFATWLDRQPLEIIRCQREGVTQLVTSARRFTKKRSNGRTPFIVIDHIGKVKPRDPKLSADRISADVTVELKALADETGSAVLVLNQRNGYGTKRDNPRPIDEDLYGGEGAKADYDSVIFLYRPQKYRSKRVATAATDRDWKIIQKVYGEFGDEEEIRSVAEVGVIKNRFGNPEIRERLRFVPEYTRYESLKPTRDQELF